MENTLEQLRYVSIGAYVYATLNAIGVLVLIVAAVIIFRTTPTGSPSNILEDPTSSDFLSLAILVALIAFSVFLVTLQFLMAYYLRIRRNYRACIVLAAVTCVNLPIGTALGIWGLIVLTQPGTRKLFDQPT